MNISVGAQHVVISLTSLPTNVQNALAGAGITSPEALANHTEDELRRKKNIGPTSLRFIKAFLASAGLALRAPGEAPLCLCVACPIHRGGK